MQARQMFSLVFVASLITLAPACVIHSGGDGNFSFSSGGDKAERNETLPLELAAGEELQVELPYGNITVRVADGEAAHVDAHWHAGGEDKAMAEAVLARYRLDLKRGPGSLSISSVGEPLAAKGAFSFNRYGASVDLSLVVPSKVKLLATSASGTLSASGELGSCRLKSSYGAVSASGVRGETTLETASGTVKVADIEAQGVDASSQYGDIEALNIRAAKVQLSTSSGHVKAREVAGALSIKSSYGDLNIDGGSGDLDAFTSSGNIGVNGLGSARRTLVSKYGNIAVQGASGELDAKTSSGEVEVKDANGSVRAVSSYGNVKVMGRLTALNAETSSGNVDIQAFDASTISAPWHISSGYGDVHLSIPKTGFSCQIEARAGSGEVHCEGFEAGDGKTRRTVSHVFNAGGGMIEVKSASGDVHITLH